MTLSTSAVAVCCCSDSVRSSVRCLHLVEQPHVLDRDHGLVGEGLHQLDLLLREGPHGSRASGQMTPIDSPSRNSGTPSMVRWPPSRRITRESMCGSCRISAICDGTAGRTARPIVLTPSTGRGFALRNSPRLGREADVHAAHDKSLALAKNAAHLGVAERAGNSPTSPAPVADRTPSG